MERTEQTNTEMERESRTEMKRTESWTEMKRTETELLWNIAYTIICSYQFSVSRDLNVNMFMRLKLSQKPRRFVVSFQQ